MGDASTILRTKINQPLSNSEQFSRYTGLRGYSFQSPSFSGENIEWNPAGLLRLKKLASDRLKIINQVPWFLFGNRKI